MHENSAFPTPVKIFVDQYIKSLDRVWIRNSIVEIKYNTLKGVSMDRKRCESGVRAVLKGHKGEARSSSPSNEEDIIPVDDSQSSDGPMRDCIVVQF